ncbi:MAG: hypothetical protein OJF51_000255 [Nitrospira sp.]|nr:MAG: hypothetical protein OJF51_000255 [Nitrospira sp.]
MRGNKYPCGISDREPVAGGLLDHHRTDAIRAVPPWQRYLAIPAHHQAKNPGECLSRSMDDRLGQQLAHIPDEDCFGGSGSRPTIHLSHRAESKLVLFFSFTDRLSSCSNGSKNIGRTIIKKSKVNWLLISKHIYDARKGCNGSTDEGISQVFPKFIRCGRTFIGIESPHANGFPTRVEQP